MKTIAILAIVAILAAGVVASLIPIQQASASGSAKGSPSANSHAFNDGTTNAYTHTPANQPCSTNC
jgi:hypothetical protein